MNWCSLQIVVSTNENNSTQKKFRQFMRTQPIDDENLNDLCSLIDRLSASLKSHEIRFHSLFTSFTDATNHTKVVLLGKSISSHRLQAHVDGIRAVDWVNVDSTLAKHQHITEISNSFNFRGLGESHILTLAKNERNKNDDNLSVLLRSSVWISSKEIAPNRVVLISSTDDSIEVGFIMNIRRRRCKLLRATKPSHLTVANIHKIGLFEEDYSFLRLSNVVTYNTSHSQVIMR
ncbi:CLUMA_CG018297, isoform A [Clunio marinus]|uniref:CLUMA_CG018297, isoform A n=1 Tax=Clunio marinus TaxID=568069 RepID=A0A1J1J060_9DIPT|nr:CLUMA_CG018297, isoform A [Clunio marinus]